MGLLDRLSATNVEVKPAPKPVADKTVIQKKSNTVGLLKKSLGVENTQVVEKVPPAPKDRLDFFDFINRHSIQYAALFTLTDNIYYAQYSAGFDGMSVCQSVSTKDFWDGLAPQRFNPYTFSAGNNSIGPLYQFFSGTLKDKIDSVCVYRAQDDSIFVFCNFTLYNDLKDIGFIDAKLDGQLPPHTTQSFDVDFTEAIDSFIFANHKTEYKDKIFTAVSNALLYRLKAAFNEESGVSLINPGQFKIVIDSSDTIPFELISNHLRLDCSYILNEHSQLLSVKELKAE